MSEKSQFWGQLLCTCSPLKEKISLGLHELSQYVGNWSSSPDDESELSPTSIQSCLPLLQGLGCRKSPSARFRPTRLNTITIVNRIEKKTFFDPIGECNRTWPGSFVLFGNAVHTAKSSLPNPLPFLISNHYILDFSTDFMALNY